uniref:Uncharacterized protein n=1 Tax=Anguilla anguilla TaxID=7936 RepID=A0A0E9VA28_ANGAN
MCHMLLLYKYKCVILKIKTMKWNRYIFGNRIFPKLSVCSDNPSNLHKSIMNVFSSTN